MLLKGSKKKDLKYEKRDDGKGKDGVLRKLTSVWLSRLIFGLVWNNVRVESIFKSPDFIFVHRTSERDTEWTERDIEG